MNAPAEAQWARVEQLADEISHLPTDQIPQRLSELVAAGESPTVLTLLGTWLALPPLPEPFKPGDELGGRYVLGHKLGEGGMGSVWRARQQLIGRDVALKIIHPALVTPALQARFVAEMEILGQLNHPGIVRIFDAGVHGLPGGEGIPFFAMELVEGQTLDRWAATRRHRRVEVLGLLVEVCAALASAHERQIVHRDLKPSNILVRNNGKPVLLDFGIARLRGFVLGEEEGVFSGTPLYAAPEQHLGRDHDFRSGESVDIYGIGAILFEALGGRRLFEFERGASIEQMRRAILDSPTPRLAQVLADCPPALDEIVSRALRRDPADRFYSIAALGRALHRVGTMISSPQASPPVWRPAERAIIPGTSWVLTERIGQGGAGEVWTGIHKQLGERRVFKFCDTEEKARTLKREVTLFRLLKERVGRNPHFITLHEVSLDEPPWYLMMDFVEARDLASWCAAQPGGLASLPENQRLEIVIQAADGLQAAHEAGILHRDIKPANLLVRDDASHTIHVFIADFGIGQIVTDQLLRDQTRLGFTQTVSDLRSDRLSGTLLYLAPEILEGNPATIRSDIYSLGVVLWQLLIGNLAAALDPSDWHARVPDPLLKDVLYRCLAGSPAKRWASAGELAAALRALPERRAAEERRRAEIAARERAAYRRGILRTAAIAGMIIAAVLFLASWAWIQRGRAERAQAEIALEQAKALPQSDLTAGRRDKGQRQLKTAARLATDLPRLRTAAASVLGLADLVKAPPSASSVEASPVMSHVSAEPGEVCRAVSGDGTLLAVARDLDGLNGAIDLIDPAMAKPRLTITRKDFPWVPIAEPGLLRFSPDHNWLAVGGAATSHHVLFFHPTNAVLGAYLFLGSEPLSCAWHPAGRLFATGSADGTIRIWDLAAAVSAKATAPAGSQFDLPPALDVPAMDHPLYVLQGQRDGVQQLAFSSAGSWLAALDHAGYLRIFAGFPHRPPNEPLAHLDQQTAWHSADTPTLSVEVRLEPGAPVTRLAADAESVTVYRAAGAPACFRLLRGELPVELPLAADPVHVAWNDTGTELCVLSLTDAYWINATRLEMLFHAPGLNPDAVAWNRKSSSWLLPRDGRLDSLQLLKQSGRFRLQTNSAVPLVEAEKGQGAVTALAAAGDGRTAVYYGRRVQFFETNGTSLTGSVLAQGGGGRFVEVLWDEPGRLLGVVFAQTNTQLRVESWKTSLDFPPHCEPLPPLELKSQRVTAANNGQTFLARDTQRGLVRVEPATAAQVPVDSSNEARQDAALACSADGTFLAMVVDRSVIRILRMPGGSWFADLHSPRLAAINALCWDRSGARLAALTDDGRVQLWNLLPWQQWLAARHLL
jgi:serine/threonine protein kinase/WD40 repeat protein